MLKELFFLFTMRENRMLSMSIPSAELAKCAANAMLAARISFMN
jgi:UDPglucose 6-dehydrogenase